MPPLSLTQSKYAFATLPIVVKSTPGISIPMPPILIGRPVAFLPVPSPHTDFVADALPDPTGAVAEAAPVANAATSSASTPVLASAALSFLDRMRTLLWVSAGGEVGPCGEPRRHELDVPWPDHLPRR